MINHSQQLALGIFGGEPKLVMRELIVVLLPAIIAMFYAFGWGVVLNISIAIVSAFLAESLVLRLRRIPLYVLRDGSTVVTALLLALALPPHLPWWITAIASVCAVVIGKQLYGGLGNNLFNPAMVGYAIVIIAYPLHLTVWPDAALLNARFDLLSAIDYATKASGENYITRLTGATPLDLWRHTFGWNPRLPIDTLHWNIINLCFLTGGLWLLLRGIISWHVPCAVLATLAVLAMLFPVSLSPLSSAYLHLSCGATMVGAFFIATDPVTAPRHAKMKLLFGIGIGVLIFIIRRAGSYADGIAFAVLIMNMFVPLMDRYAK